MSGQKIAVGLSGGVDSSVAAAILKEQGYDVTGVFIEAYNEPGCRTDQDKKDALKAALHLGIPFQVLDVRQDYKKKVVDYFFESYREGKTPNPDIVCNSEVKFGLFFDWARHNGFEAVATGHYARIDQEKKLIQRAQDTTKDQSYFLWRIQPDHLKHIIWPLGSMTKNEVRAKARALKLENAEKPDSMGICMIGELNVTQFLRTHLGEKEGNVILNGQKIGTHHGLWFHTIGQRGGFEIYKRELKKLGYHPEAMEPLYVIGKNIGTNELLVGGKEQAMTHRITVTNYELRISANGMRDLVQLGKLSVRIRNLGELEEVAAVRVLNDTLSIMTAAQIFGVAEGQGAVLYARYYQNGEETVVGGGEIGLE